MLAIKTDDYSRNIGPAFSFIWSSMWLHLVINFVIREECEYQDNVLIFDATDSNGDTAAKLTHNFSNFLKKYTQRTNGNHYFFTFSMKNHL